MCVSGCPRSLFSPKPEKGRFVQFVWFIYSSADSKPSKSLSSLSLTNRVASSGVRWRLGSSSSSSSSISDSMSEVRMPAFWNPFTMVAVVTRSQAVLTQRLTSALDKALGQPCLHLRTVHPPFRVQGDDDARGEGLLRDGLPFKDDHRRELLSGRSAGKDDRKVCLLVTSRLDGHGRYAPAVDGVGHWQVKRQRDFIHVDDVVGFRVPRPDGSLPKT